MAVAYVDTCVADWSSGTTFANAAAFTPSAGEAFAVFVFVESSDNVSYKFSSICDTVNTYTAVPVSKTDLLNAHRVQICAFYVQNAAASSITPTVTVSDSSIAAATFAIVRWTGVDTTSALDVGAGQIQTDAGVGAGNICTSSVTTTAAGDAITIFTETNRGGSINLTNPTATDGTTMTSQFNRASTPEATMVATGTQSAAGAINGTFTADFSDASTSWFSAIIALKASTSATSWGALLSDRLNRLVRS